MNNAEKFCWWLQGYYNLRAHDDEKFTGFNFAQTREIKKRLDLVLNPQMNIKPGSMSLDACAINYMDTNE